MVDLICLKIKNVVGAGMWESLLQAMCGHRDGGDDRRKKVYRVLRKKIQPKVLMIILIDLHVD